MKPKDETKPYESRLLEDLHPKLIPIVQQAEIEFDKQFASEVNVFTTCTYRNNARQNQLFAQTNPRVTWSKGGQSPHNVYPSCAWDVAFLNTATKKLDWSPKYFDAYHAIVDRVSAYLGTSITWGADWNRDNIKDKIKQDAPHHQLTFWKK